MVVAIHQPEHLPWLGFFNKMANADEFIVLDNVQYCKRNFQNRNRILVNGVGTYISVPVELEKYREKTIADMEIYSDSVVPWKSKYLKMIEYNYKHHPFFGEYFPFFEDLVEKDITNLCQFNMEIIQFFAQQLQIVTKIVMASSLAPQGRKSDLILDISKRAGANVYLSGSAGRNYMDLPKYYEDGVEVWFNDFEHPVYHQKGSDTFVSHLSVLDLLMNVGGTDGKKIIMSGTVINKQKEVICYE